MKFLTIKFLSHLIFTFIAMSLVACQSSTPTITPNNDTTQITPAGDTTQAAPDSKATPVTSNSDTAETPVSEATKKTTAPTSTPAHVDSTSPLLNTAWDDRSIFSPGLISTEQETLNRLPGVSIYHIDFQISDDFLFLTGQEEIHYTNREEVPLNEVYFRLFPNTSGGATTVSAVKVNGQDVEPAYEFEDSALRVPLPMALFPGEQVNVRLNFEVEVAQEMAGNYGLFGYFDNVLVLDEFYPAIPVYDDEGWNVEIPPPNADSTYFDAGFYLVRVTAPANLTIVASGIEVESKQEAGNQTLTFAAGPARDFYLAAGEDYTVVNQTVGETTINSYAFSDRTSEAEMAAQIAADSLKIFNERFGPYPYTEFDVLSTPMQALGIEYPGIVGITLALYNSKAQVAGLPAPILLESVVAHEAAHQWFYNVIGNDQIDEPWLDEALAQYATGLYYVDLYGEDAAQGYLSSWDDRWERVDRADIPIGLPADAYVGDEYGAIVYGRGPLFVAALAEKMGQEPFDKFLRDYYETHKWNISTGDSFKQLAEHHCRCDLTALFETWVTPASSSIWPTEGWQNSTPEQQGLDSELLAEMFETIEEQDYAIDSVTVVRNGYIVADAAIHPFRPDSKHVVNSCTKSVVSALIGIAIDKGYIESVQQPVLDFFPERTTANLDADKEAMTLEHLLTMSTGLECRDSYLYDWQGIRQMWQSDDWVQFMLDLPLAESPGSRFEYCNGASFLLSAIIQKTTGMNAADFAQEHLFGPLGITDVEWDTNPQGISIGWAGIEMRPHDMAKIGYLYLNGGQWAGEQIVPAAWVENSTRKHISATLQDGYGYQWWVTDNGVYMALGYAGQFIFVVPDHQLVVVFVSDLAEQDFYVPQNLLNDFIIPAAESSAPLPDNADGLALLKTHIQTLANP